MKKVVLMLVISCSVGFSNAVWAKTAVEFYRSAQAYDKKKETKAAIIELKNALKEDPSHVPSRLLLGKIYLTSGKPSYAEKELRRARRLKADPNEWLIALGKTYLYQGKIDTFLAEITILPTLNKSNKSQVESLRGQAFLSQENQNAAKTAFEQALRFDANGQSAKVGLAKIKALNGDFAAAEKDIDQVLQQAPNDLQALEFKLKIKLNQKQPEAAASLTEQILQLQPFNHSALMVHAALMLQQNDLEAVDKDIQQIKKYYPRSPIAYYFKAVILVRQEQLEDAKSSVQKMLSVVPTHQPSQLLMGKITYRLNQYHIAEEYLAKVIATSPGNIEAAMLYAAIHMRNNKPKKAIDLLEPFAEDLAQNVQFLSLLGSAYHRAKQYDKGIEYLQKAVTLNPDKTAIRAQLALSQLEAGKDDKALLSLESALAADENFLQVDLLYIYTLMRNEEYQKAEKAANDLFAKMQGSPVPHNLLGAVHLAQNKLDEAIADFNKALAIKPDFTAAEFALAKVYLTQKDNEKAKLHLHNVLQIDPKNLRALVLLAELEAKAGRVKEMEALLLEADKISKKSPQPGVMLVRYYLTKDKAQALTKASALNQQFPNTKPVLKVLAKAQLANGRYGEAIDNIRTLLEEQPDALDLNYLLAGAYGLNQQAAVALKAIEKVMAIKPDYLPGMVSHVELLVANQQYDKALAVAQNIVKLVPDRARGYQLMGAVLQAQKSHEKALTWFEKAYQKEQKRDLLLSIYRLKTALGHATEALLNTWLAKYPKDSGVRTFLAMTYQAQNLQAQAIVEYDKTLAENPANAIALNNLAWIYLARDEQDRSIEFALRASKAAPKSADILDTLGWVQIQTGQLEKGIRTLKQALNVRPNNMTIQYHYAVGLSKVNKAQEAGKILKKILRVSTRFPEKEQAQALMRQLGQ